MIYTCYHRTFPVLQSDIIKPLQVGRACAKVALDMAGDDTGDNISAQNPYFCELTATYWLWKNCTDDIIGLQHYRRFFNFKDKYTKTRDLSKYLYTREEVTAVLQNFDIILPKYFYNRTTAYKDYAKYHYAEDIDLALEIIRQKYPDMAETAQKTINANYLYFANMLIARKEVFDDYAAWLFSILFEAEKLIQPEVLKRDAYQQRVYGFLSERLTAIYIAAHPELKVKELPVVFYTDSLKEYIKYRIKTAKRKFLTKLGLGKKSWKI